MCLCMYVCDGYLFIVIVRFVFYKLLLVRRIIAADNFSNIYFAQTNILGIHILNIYAVCFNNLSMYLLHATIGIKECTTNCGHRSFT